VPDFEIIPPQTPTRMSRFRVRVIMYRLISAALRHGYRFRLIVTEDQTQNDREH
jgi:hypothetical protein